MVYSALMDRGEPFNYILGKEVITYEIFSPLISFKYFYISSIFNLSSFIRNFLTLTTILLYSTITFF